MQFGKGNPKIRNNILNMQLFNFLDPSFGHYTKAKNRPNDRFEITSFFVQNFILQESITLA